MVFKIKILNFAPMGLSLAEAIIGLPKYRPFGTLIAVYGEKF